MTEMPQDLAPDLVPDPSSRALREPEVTGTPALRLVPDLPRPLGDGLLGEEARLDQELVVRRRVQVTHDVVTLVLEPTVPGGLSYRPGQFLTLVVDVDGVPVERCYTISSPPSRPHLLTITVKRLPGGVLTPYLHERLAVGERVTARGPLGDFCVADHPAAGYVLLSAGSGITPTLSTVRTMADLGELGGPAGADVVVVHSARTPADLVCRAELEALATTYDGLRLLWVCEDDAPGATTPWTGARGRLSAALLQEAVPDLAERQVFVCGPPGYMAATRTILDDLGVAGSRRHEESFVLGATGAPALAAGLSVVPEVPEVLAPALPEGGASPTVRFGRSGLEVACTPGTTVLEAARQAGVILPSSCGEGFCGTCKSGLLGGRVEMHHQGGIRPREVAQGQFLPCCSTPDGDIVVDA